MIAPIITYVRPYFYVLVIQPEGGLASDDNEDVDLFESVDQTVPYSD